LFQSADPLIISGGAVVSERFIDLNVQAECVVLLLEVSERFEERKALLHELRLVISELDLEVEETLPMLLGVDFIKQMESLADSSKTGARSI